MSTIDLADAKAFLDVIHSSDDVKLQALLDGAEREALNFMNRRNFVEICPSLPEDDPDYSSEYAELGDEMSDAAGPYGLPADVRTAVLFLLQASYQAAPDDVVKLRKIAEVQLMPYRCEMGF